MGDLNTNGSFRECPFCGARLPMAARFCAFCGGPLPDIDTKQISEEGSVQNGFGFYNRQSGQGGYHVFDMPGLPQPQSRAGAEPQNRKYGRRGQAQDWPFQDGFEVFDQQPDQVQDEYPIFDMPFESEPRAEEKARAEKSSRAEQSRANQGSRVEKSRANQGSHLEQSRTNQGSHAEQSPAEQGSHLEQFRTEQGSREKQAQDWPFQDGFVFFDQQSDQDQGGFPVFDMTEQTKPQPEEQVQAKETLDRPEVQPEHNELPVFGMPVEAEPQTGEPARPVERGMEEQGGFRSFGIADQVPQDERPEQRRFQPYNQPGYPQQGAYPPFGVSDQPWQSAFPAYPGTGQGQNQEMPFQRRGYSEQYGQQGRVIPDRTGRPPIPRRIKRVFKPAATDIPGGAAAEEEAMFAKSLPDWSIKPPCN